VARRRRDGGAQHPTCICAASALRDAGTPEVSGLDLPAQDLAGHDRIQGGRADDGDAHAAGEMTTA
jgi:hypothetical protein